MGLILKADSLATPTPSSHTASSHTHYTNSRPAGARRASAGGKGKDKWE